MSEIKTVGVLGSGLMGSGIAQVAATAGYTTIVRDVAQPVLDKAKAGIEKSLAKFVKKGKLDAAGRDAALGRLRFTTAVADLKPSDVAIDAVTKDLQLKNSLGKALDDPTAPAVLPASRKKNDPLYSTTPTTRQPNCSDPPHRPSHIPHPQLVSAANGTRALTYALFSPSLRPRAQARVEA